MELSNMPASTAQPSFLCGGGQMGKLIGQHDWSKTAIGPIEGWPQSLKTTLNIILKSKFPMFLWWGADLVQFYNDAYRPILGNNGKHPAALGQKGQECWAEVWPLVEPKVKRVFSHCESIWNENELLPIYRNGRMEDVYWTFSYSGVTDEKGKVEGLLIVCTETTQEIKAIKTLKQSEERFQNLVREATVGIIVLIGEEMRVEIVNVMFGRLIDRAPEELLGKQLFSIIPEAIDPFLALLNKVRLTGEPLYLYDQPYFVYVNGCKKHGFGSVVLQPYKDSNGAIVGVMAIAHDVTEQVLDRQKVEQAEAKARLAIESADLGTYEVDYATDEITTSERFDAILGIPHGLTRKEIVARLHPQDAAARLQAHGEAVKSGHLHYEARIIWPNQTTHWVRVKGTVVYDEKGKPLTLLGVVQDINEQKIFAEHLSSLVTERTLELQRSNDDLLQFAHVTSHDLKEPVRKIKLYNGRLQDEFGDLLPEKGKAYLHKVQNATDRMFAMIDGVLNYSAVSSSDQAIETLELEKIINVIITDLEVTIQQKNAIIKTSALPSVEGASVLIYQLFYNILNNALKFSRPEEIPVISITSAIVQQNGIPMASLQISDNGIGFEQEYADKIFNNFTRLNPKDTFEGTGIGLALCKKIVERHGGNIAAAGVKNQGAVFTVTLPLTQKQ